MTSAIIFAVIEVVRMPYGLRRAGFGHPGDSVAQINVISVEEVAVD